MPPKKTPAQPTRASSRVIPSNTSPEAVAGAQSAPGKRGSDDGHDDRPTKQRKVAQKPAATATNAPKPVKPKAVKPKAPAAVTQKATTKRKSEGVDDSSTKRPRTTSSKRVPPPAKTLPIINTAPVEKLDVLVFGEGDFGELGLGPNKKSGTSVKRPRLHPFLSSGDVDVVYVALGGMHAAVLTRSNEILTWGVNDNHALGRDTYWEGGLRDMDAGSTDSDSDDDEAHGLNPKESTPGVVTSGHFTEGTKFVQLAAGDSCTLALTADGLVYGWGTFRDNNGVLGFRPDLLHASTPMLIPELKNIKHIVCGNNHALALDIKGNVFAWGAGEQNQLGRRIVERTRLSCLVPREIALPKRQTSFISSGGEHSFAITNNDKVYAWGLNNYGQTGIPDNAGGDEAIVPSPTVVTQLSQYKLSTIKGGSHHSVAVTDKGDCLAWGRATGGQIGIALNTIPEQDLIMNHGKPGILKKPTPIPGIKCKYVTTASDHSIAITTDGKAYSWGFGALYQTGLGTDEDAWTATLIDNTAVRGRNLNWAGTGGQYSALTSLAAPPSQQKSSVMVNGTSTAAVAAPLSTAAVPRPKQPSNANAGTTASALKENNRPGLVNGITGTGIPLQQGKLAHGI